MPLSKHDQKILAELEESLIGADPRLAKTMKGVDTVVWLRRRTCWGVAGFIAGLIVLVAFFTVSVWWGLAGAATMVASTFVVEHYLPLLLRASKSERKITTD